MAYDAVPKLASFIINCVGKAYFDTHALCDVEYLNIHTNSNGDFSSDNLASSTGSKNVELVAESTGSSVELLPSVMVDYKANFNNTGRKQFTIYTRYANSNYYVGFDLTHEYSDIPIYYQNYTRITRGMLYQYQDGNMTSIDTIILANGESECVFQDMSGGIIDHTGGTHGDEQTIELRFYIDGVLLTDADLADDFFRTCEKFHYIEKSSLHKTGKRYNVDTGLPATGSGVVTINVTTKNFVIDGQETNIVGYSQNSYITASDLAAVTVSKSASNTWVLNSIIQPDDNHTLLAYHWKQTLFTVEGYNTKNRVQWKVSVPNYIYCGIVCVGKSNTQFIYNETLDEFVEVTNDGGYKLEHLNTDLREINFTNPSSKLAAHVTSKFVRNDMDTASNIFVWDTTNYTKYYRRNATRKPQVDEMYIMECDVRFLTLK